MRRRRSRPVAKSAPRARPPGRKVGLLGGSFNPAHEGHRHISLLALKRLGLHEVWWLVSPQNPLKPRAGMAAFDERLAAARAAAGDRRLHVSDIERRLGTCYSVDTIARLKRRFRRHRLVWIIGADNLPTLAAWRLWPALFRAIPVAVIDRWPYSRYASVVKPAKRFARQRLAERRAPGLARSKPPAWMIIHGPLHPASATALRAGSDVRGP
ncbi:MAG: nicotinic acid mononucleotide adenylyltransferase [Rhodospirillales bacterium]|nr:nicotinic acid mononucleotide adenylyltransferase [Rhodospirillales bacterium]